MTSTTGVIVPCSELIKKLEVSKEESVTIVGSPTLKVELIPVGSTVTSITLVTLPILAVKEIPVRVIVTSFNTPHSLSPQVVRPQPDVTVGIRNFSLR